MQTLFECIVSEEDMQEIFPGLHNKSDEQIRVHTNILTFSNAQINTTRVGLDGHDIRRCRNHHGANGSANCVRGVAHDTYLSVNDMYHMYVESIHVGYWHIGSFMRGIMYSLASTELAVSCNSELCCHAHCKFHPQPLP